MTQMILYSYAIELLQHILNGGANFSWKMEFAMLYMRPSAPSELVSSSVCVIFSCKLVGTFGNCINFISTKA